MDLVHINTITVIVRLLLAAIIGAAIGIEREHRKQAAGLRTHMLICIGATLAMLTNQYMFENLKMSTDGARIGAQVISGIGFLGVGTIIVTSKQKVRGLTTAAGLWASACCGLAAGVGFYEGAIIGGVVIFVVLSVIHNVDSIIDKRQKEENVYIEICDINSIDLIKALLNELNIEINSIDINRITTPKGDLLGININIVADKKSTVDIISSLSHIEDIYFIKRM